MGELKGVKELKELRQLSFGRSFKLQDNRLNSFNSLKFL